MFKYIFTQSGNIFLQKRSSNVKDYKGMINVTVGGHLLNNETVDKGNVRLKRRWGFK